MDPITIARSYVEEMHAGAEASILGGSAALGRSTPTSDLDIAILYRAGGANYAETLRYRGWIVEAFIHTPESLAFWYEKERSIRCAVIGDICARGLLLTDNGAGKQWQDEARLYMRQGPMPLTDAERDLRRYDLSCSMDDLLGSGSPAETFATASDVFRQTAELLLLRHQKWLGNGKWVVRRLEQLPKDEAALGLLAWAASKDNDPQKLAGIARDVLDQNGGYAMEGFLRGAR
ncbi:nucleotidyltransferase domain-containing protein [Arthrobacter sp. PAMC 25486]|uniref:nucleotidyltransferase domain-containing protein n=1 Tax=Arthrobacter sp. PAMC 25486 TaxID=1494608 RepID=UPI0006919606|nr:nucleotidyltransferase domain-containing protein [Arthrobacter sp. PAMC 25486]